MTNITLAPSIKELYPDFKIGYAIYHNIVVEKSPQMVRGRFQFFQETMMMDLEQIDLISFPAVSEWRSIFKEFGTDPARYRPSSESLLRRLKKGSTIPLVHSAADINNLLSLQYKIPIGIYDLDQIDGDVTIDIGTNATLYESLNGREVSFNNKIYSFDQKGAFGSPIVDSKRTAVMENTTNAIQLFYLQPSLPLSECIKLVNASAEMFHQIHGGNVENGISN